MDLTFFEKAIIQIISCFLLCGFCFTIGFLIGANAKTENKENEDFNIEDLEI